MTNEGSNLGFDSTENMIPYNGTKITMLLSLNDIIMTYIDDTLILLMTVTIECLTALLEYLDIFQI